MAEIHDQFDTILILDFGSQVGLPCPRSQYVLTSTTGLVQSPHNKEMPRVERICGAHAVHNKAGRC